MTGHETTGPIGTGRIDCAPILPPAVDAGKVARWLEMAEFALDNGPERVDALLELAGSLEAAWDALCDLEAAS